MVTVTTVSMRIKVFYSMAGFRQLKHLQCHFNISLCSLTLVTVQSNYNLYARYTSRVFQRGQGNNHACTYKFTLLQNTCDSYMSCSHACAIYYLVLSVCESRLVTQFYKSNATSALEPVSKIYCYRRICQCCGLLSCLSLIYEIC